MVSENPVCRWSSSVRGLAALFRDAQKIVRRLSDPGVQVRVLGFRGPFRA